MWCLKIRYLVCLLAGRLQKKVKHSVFEEVKEKIEECMRHEKS